MKLLDALLSPAAPEIERYDLVCVTSPNGVDALFERLRAAGKDARAFGGARVAAIGPGTAKRLTAAGIRADIVPDRFESGVSLLASRTFMDQTVKPEILLIHSLNRDGWMVRPQVSWTFATNWRAAVGADIFHGPPTALFGQYDNADRVYAQVRYAS